MLRGTARAVAWLFLAAAAGCDCEAALDDPRSYVPADALAVGEIDVPALARTPFVEKLLSSAITPPVRGLPETCGTDVFAQIRTLEVVVPHAPHEAGDVGVVAVGRLDRSELVACAKRRARDRGSSIGEKTLHGITLHYDRDLPGGALAFPVAGVVLGGTRAGLRQMIETAKGTRERMPDSSEHFALRDRLGRDRQLWLAARIPPDVRRQAMKRLEQEYHPFLAVSWIAVGIRLASGIQLSAIVRAIDEPAATLIESIARRLLRRAREEPVFTLSPFGPVFRRLQIDRDGSELVLSLTLSDRQLESIVSALDDGITLPGHDDPQ